uniref:NR LBD domain-containing protein n=1 Tax=Heterorhabditis bacteriophora TaxID=37862 RepID=A0A1I7XCI9_HETBA
MPKRKMQVDSVMEPFIGKYEDIDEYSNYEEVCGVVVNIPVAVQNERDRNVKAKGSVHQRSLSTFSNGTYKKKRERPPTNEQAIQTDEPLSPTSRGYIDLPGGRNVKIERIATPPECHDLPTPSSFDIYTIPDTLMALENQVFFHTPIEADYSINATKVQINLPFEVVFRRPMLVSPRYPMRWVGERILTPNDLIDGWRRHFIYYSDWCRGLDDFQMLTEKDQDVLARRRIHLHGWLVFLNSYFCVLFHTNCYLRLSHSYYSMKCGAPGLCFANGAFHPLEGGHPSIIEFYKQCMPRLMNYVIGPMRSMGMDDVEFVLLKAIVFFAEVIADYLLCLCAIPAEVRNRLKWGFPLFAKQTAVDRSSGEFLVHLDGEFEDCESSEAFASMLSGAGPLDQCSSPTSPSGGEWDNFGRF